MTSSTPPFALVDLLAAPLVIAGLIDGLVAGIRRWRSGGDRLPAVEPDELYRQAQAADRAGRVAAARDAYEEVVRRAPEHARAHSRLGGLATARGDHQVALAHALHALRAEETVDTLL